MDAKTLELAKEILRQSQGIMTMAEAVTKAKAMIRLRDRPGHCGGCGGELDGEGWCANYCEAADFKP